MKYFIDTEFIEGIQDKTIMDIKYGETKPTIDLISIGIVTEDGREYYAVSKDFNLKEAWNRYDLKQRSKENINVTPALGSIYKEYWIRDNVLKAIFFDLLYKDIDLIGKYYKFPTSSRNLNDMIINEVGSQAFNYKNLKRLINRYGKTNKQIAEEIYAFTSEEEVKQPMSIGNPYEPVCEFYAYYADYDWVAFCWLFGKMLDLPKGFPKYCIDLKQELDRIANVNTIKVRSKTDGFSEREYFLGDYYNTSFNDMIKYIKEHKEYPKQVNEHNALADAKWNYKLYKFLQSL